MEVRNVNTPSAGTNNDPVHCFVAIEISKIELGRGISDGVNGQHQSASGKSRRREGANRVD